jgi:hypothetical protein
MKFDKWTVALASIGLVSLAGVTSAEEKANMVQTALSGTSISGYVDTSAQWNFGTGNANLPTYRFGGASKADGFNLNVVQLRIEKPLDESQWAAGYRVDLWFGPDANALGTQSPFGGNEGGTQADFAIRQAYVALRTPVGNGIDWKIGVFDSIIGYESVESPNNPNFTRSYGHSIEPTTHTGLLASYRFSDLVSASVGIANTKGPNVNGRAFGEDGKAESFKSYMASIALTAPESMGFLAGSTLYGGFVTGLDDNENSSDYDGNSTSYYAGATIATPVKGLRLGASFDYLDVHDPAGVRGGETWSVAGYGSYQATEKLSLHGRVEYLKDRGNQKYFFTEAGFPGPDQALAVTATAQYDLWANVLSRLELRWDHSLTDTQVYGGTFDDPTPTRDNAWMLLANIVYKF